MFRKITLSIASVALLSLAGFASSANAAPVNLAGIAKAKADTELVQVRNGRGGGGMRSGRSFGGGRHFGGRRHFGGGFRPHGYGRKWKRRHYIYIGGGHYGSGGGCGYYWKRWQTTGSRFWKSKYYACVGY